MMTCQPEVNDHRREIIKAVRQSIQMTRWREAYALAEHEHLFEDLALWGEYNQLVDLCRWFLPQAGWQPQPKQAITIYLYLGRAYTILGNQQQAPDFFTKQALRLSQELNVHSALGEKPPLQASPTPILVVRRVIGPMEERLWGSGSGTLSPIVKPEPPIRIRLDGKEIGTIRPPKRSTDWYAALREEAARRAQDAGFDTSDKPPPEEEWSQFEIQAGHHDLTLDVPRFQGLLYSYTFLGVAPAIQSFDIAPGETVMFLCQYTPATRGHMIRLKKIG